MSESMSTPVCGLNCDFCRLYMNGECGGCGVGRKAKCNLIECTRGKGLYFSQGKSGQRLQKANDSKCLHPDWAEESGSIQLK